MKRLIRIGPPSLTAQLRVSDTSTDHSHVNRSSFSLMGLSPIYLNPLTSTSVLHLVTMLTFNLTVPLSVDFSRPEDYLIFIFHILFATCSSLLAGSVVIGIMSTRALRSQNRFIFMLNTSISDTLTGGSVFYLGLFDVQEGYPSRNGTFYILPSFLGVNVLTFVFAQFDRYLAVCHPFFYKRYVTRGVVIGVCALCWIYTYSILTVQSVVPVAFAAQMNAFGVIVLQVIVAIKVLMTIKLYMIARHQLSREMPSSDKESKKESLRIIVYVVICFLILWAPSFVNISVKYVTKTGLRFRNEATNLFAIMARLNALSTPALYIWGSPSLRAAVWSSVWSKIFKRRTTRVDSGHVKPKKGGERILSITQSSTHTNSGDSRLKHSADNHDKYPDL